ncbi:MAG: DUF1579 family protein [Phycisphaerales bacterium JB040]
MGAHEQGTMPAEMVEAFERMGRTTEEHELLRQFEGSWNSTVKMFCGPPGADPQESHGVMVNELDLGGKFLRQTYEDNAGMFSGRGYWGYNAIDGRWEGFWIDSMTTMFNLETGTYDARSRTWTMRGTGTNPMSTPGSRSTTVKRSVIRIVSDDEHVMEMYHAPEGRPGEESLGMEITYVRA